jgi:hypothetical protein
VVVAGHFHGKLHHLLWFLGYGIARPQPVVVLSGASKSQRVVIRRETPYHLLWSGAMGTTMETRSVSYIRKKPLRVAVATVVLPSIDMVSAVVPCPYFNCPLVLLYRLGCACSRM